MSAWKPTTSMLLVLAFGMPCLGSDLLKDRPAIKVSGESAEISFSVHEYTDVAVEVLNARKEVIRHLGAGMLGPNAPQPFQKNSKAQVIGWDLKDNQGNRVDPKDAQIFVRAGLKPTFERTLGWTGQTLGIIKGMCVDRDGNLYVTSQSMPITYRIHTYTKVFDREGNYLRAINPPPASLPEEKLKGLKFVDLPGGRRIPAVRNLFERDIHGIDLSMHQPVITGDGKFLFPTAGGKYSSRLAAIGTDGSVGEDFVGAVIGQQEPPYDQAHRTKVWPRVYLAASPDDRFVYASGIGRAYHEPRPENHEEAARDNCVYRFDRNAKDDFVPFLGEKFAKDGLLSNPLGIDVDAQGNLYICDYGHNRIAVYGPDGKARYEVPVERPVQVAVHPSGKMYVYCAEGLAKGQNINSAKLTHKLVRFGAGEKPAKELEMNWPEVHARCQPTLALDKHAAQPILWLGSFAGQGGYFWYKGNIRKIVDQGDAFEDLGDVITGKAPDEQFGRDHKFVLVDPKTDEVWWDHLIFDGRTGDRKGTFKAFDAGRALLGTPGAFAGEPRLGPDNTVVVFKGGHVHRYNRDGSAGPPFAATGSYKSAEIADFRGHVGRNFLKGIHLDDHGNIYLLGSRSYSGSKTTSVLHKIAADGSLAARDIVQLEANGIGLALDRRGSIYIGVNLTEFDQPVPACWEDFVNAKAYSGQGSYTRAFGSLIKFKPSGGRILIDPAGTDYRAYNGKSQREMVSYKVVEGVEWSRYPTYVMGGGICNCEVVDLETDGHNRLFVPDPLTYSVWVFDENGNPITRFGEYGNMDSAGPGSTVPVPEIPLSFAFRLAVSNSAVYVNDSHAQRVLKVRLDYKQSMGLRMDGSPID